MKRKKHSQAMNQKPTHFCNLRVHKLILHSGLFADRRGQAELIGRVTSFTTEETKLTRQPWWQLISTESRDILNVSGQTCLLKKEKEIKRNILISYS